MQESATGSILENILPVELGQYWKSQYWPSSTGSIFSRIAPVDDSGVGVLKIHSYFSVFHRWLNENGIYNMVLSNGRLRGGEAQSSGRSSWDPFNSRVSWNCDKVTNNYLANKCPKPQKKKYDPNRSVTPYPNRCRSGSRERGGVSEGSETYRMLKGFYGKEPLVTMKGESELEASSPEERENEENRTEQNRTEQNRTEQNRTEQNRTEQNRTEQNRTEQNRTEQNRIEQ